MMLFDIEKNDGEYKFTRDAVTEIAKCAEDKQYFFENYVKIINHDTGLTPFKLNRAQKKFLKYYDVGKHNITTTPRQSGMTTLLAADCLHDLLFKPHTNIAYIASAHRQTQDFTLKIARMIANLPDCLCENVHISKHEIRINHNMLICTGLKGTVDGVNCNRYVFDNVSYASQRSLDDFLNKIKPVATHSKNSKMTFVDTPPLDYMLKFHGILHMDNVNRFSINFEDLEMNKDKIDVHKKSMGARSWGSEYEICWSFN